MASFRRVICSDGFHMSVQAGIGAYSDPRDLSNSYKKVEVGFVSDPEEMLIKYAEEPWMPTRTIYGYVPSEIVGAVIVKHGGLLYGEVPPGVPLFLANTKQKKT